jgi:hypothetical protein
MPGMPDPTRETWQPGDLAECIHTGPWFEHGIDPHGTGPRYAEVRMVTFVGAARCLLTGELVPILRFGRYGSRLYSSRGFRKVTLRKEALERADVRFCGDFGPRLGTIASGRPEEA